MWRFASLTAWIEPIVRLGTPPPQTTVYVFYFVNIILVIYCPKGLLLPVNSAVDMGSSGQLRQ